MLWVSELTRPPSRGQRKNIKIFHSTTGILCCGCRNESSWTEAVLFDEKGFQLTYSEVEEEFEGPWELEYNGVHYCVDVRPDTADSK